MDGNEEIQGGFSARVTVTRIAMEEPLAYSDSI